MEILRRCVLGFEVRQLVAPFPEVRLVLLDAKRHQFHPALAVTLPLLSRVAASDEYGNADAQVGFVAELLDKRPVAQVFTSVHKCSSRRCTECELCQTGTTVSPVVNQKNNDSLFHLILIIFSVNVRPIPERFRTQNYRGLNDSTYDRVYTVIFLAIYALSACKRMK